MKKKAQRWCSLGMFCCIVMVSGCSQKELVKKQVSPVSGKVTCNGEPVRFVLLELKPDDPSEGAAAEGKTDGEGAFTLRTYSNSEPDGAAPGKYKVIFHEWNPVEAGPLPEDAKPTELTDKMKAGAEVEIKGEESDLIIAIP